MESSSRAVPKHWRLSGHFGKEKKEASLVEEHFGKDKKEASLVKERGLFSKVSTCCAPCLSSSNICVRKETHSFSKWFSKYYHRKKYAYG